MLAMAVRAGLIAAVAAAFLAAACGRAYVRPAACEHANAQPLSSSAGVVTAFAFDERCGQLVAFGGVTVNQLSNETWVWDGSRWGQAHPAHSPGPRYDAAAAYDRARRTLVLYGGVSQLGVQPAAAHHTDTWTWNGTDWTSVRITNPPDLTAPQAVFDPVHQRVVLIGTHFDLANNALNGPQMWSWAGAGWQWIGAGPPIVGPRLGFDPKSQRLVAYGGFNQTVGRLYDTWTFDGSAWAKLAVATVPRAENSVVRELVLDPASDRLLLIDAIGPSSVASIKPRGDVWAWSGVDWMPVATTAPQMTAKAALEDPLHHRVLLVVVQPTGTQRSPPPVLTLAIWSWDGHMWTPVG